MDSSLRSSLALRRIDLLAGLGEPRLQALAQRCRWQHVPAERPLLLRAQDRGEVFLLVSGLVRVTTYAANGRQVTFRDLGAGEVLGDIAALDGQPRSADVLTLEDSVVAVLERSDFLALLREEPELALRVMQRLATLVRELSERVIELSTQGVQNRLHAELLRLARLAGVADNQARLAPAPRHLELAARVSTNREQVTRELNALVRAGLLQKQGGALVLTDVAQLTRMVAQVRGEAAPAPAPLS
ncbi:Crp/Fnr family transcriptional regulator [Xenophilus arseniciresistens]|uniref:Crp/Fnr family transcriptional regulator n=1 Tax=Xenophilus arseniciresistens TaxID=1283306 RepID=A0AAE3N6U0_9BURK|nr:Crp/Fnr family transcriptional regulator [Xenophilus arseniciresistens]MDA7415406.1 Crp/Fnr family transcriptional regulator [Xenophilus arseniciresistens]